MPQQLPLPLTPEAYPPIAGFPNMPQMFIVVGFGGNLYKERGDAGDYGFFHNQRLSWQETTELVKKRCAMRELKSVRYLSNDEILAWLNKQGYKG